MPEKKITKTTNRISASKRSLKKSIILTGLSTVIILLLLGYFFKPEFQTPAANEFSSPVSAQMEGPIEQSNPAYLNQLPGRWQRSDGSYVLEIISATEGGQVEAAYYNPNPINVGRANWALDKGKLYVMVELQDVNYPGSTYGLLYDEQNDKLTGKYLQAVENTTFEVEFSREQ
jgi:hypothetical protein